ncbi:MAG: AMP-binding protein [Akkermansiaceae bacterium]|nr:AMP-binding protein [Akkermansiaceae bacterium]
MCIDSTSISSISERIRGRMAEIIGVPPEQLTDEISVGDIPQWDSLTQMILINSLESEFKLPYNPDNMLKLNTVSKIMSYVCHHVDINPELVSEGKISTLTQEERQDLTFQESIRQRIAEIMCVDPKSLTDDVSVGDIPQWDSLMQMILINSLESEYQLPNDNQNMLELNSIGKIITWISQKGKQTANFDTMKDRKALVSHDSMLSQQVELTSDSIEQAKSYENQVVISSIFERASEAPTKIALVFDNESISYRQLTRGIRSAASFLKKEGVKKNDVVALYADKRKEFFFCYFGAHLLGATVLNLNPAIQQELFHYVTNETAPSLILGSGLGAKYAYACINFPAAETFQPTEFPDMDSIAEIMFTTGTTHLPKGVRITHSNQAAFSLLNPIIGISSKDTEVIALPLHHVFGIGMSFRLLAAGGTVIFTQTSNPIGMFEALRDYKATGIAMPASGWMYLRKVSGDSAMAEFSAHLRHIVMASMPVPMELREYLIRIYPTAKVCVAWGLTEATMSTIIDLNIETNHLDSIGRGSPGVEIRVYSEDGVELPYGENGEICIKGPNLMKGYLRDPEFPAYHGDFFRTGDWGSIDVAGYVHLVGRVKDIINIGGEKVNPIEIENILNTIPGVTESACVPCPDPQGVLGEVVKAILVWDGVTEKPTDDVIRSVVLSQLERYKVPYIIEWREALMKTETGKIQRQKMKG